MQVGYFFWCYPEFLEPSSPENNTIRPRLNRPIRGNPPVSMVGNVVKTASQSLGGGLFLYTGTPEGGSTIPSGAGV